MGRAEVLIGEMAENLKLWTQKSRLDHSGGSARMVTPFGAKLHKAVTRRPPGRQVVSDNSPALRGWSYELARSSSCLQ